MIPCQHMFSIIKILLIFLEIHANEIKSVVSSLSSSEACYDEIPASIMEQLVNYYHETFNTIDQSIYFTGIFPCGNEVG